MKNSAANLYFILLLICIQFSLYKTQHLKKDCKEQKDCKPGYVCDKNHVCKRKSYINNRYNIIIK